MSQEQSRNGINIVQGEMSLVVSAMRRNARWSSHSHQDEEQDPLLHSFSQLKELLGNVKDLQDVDVIAILGPFLDVIRSEDTTGPITGFALSAVNKFLCYGLIDPTSDSTPSGIESLADAVTHARFVGTDPSSDEVVLMKILQVLRTLLLTPVGAHLTNESVCEIMQSCFRICFELRLSELLRKTAEQTLMDMVQLLASRLPQLKEEEEKSGNNLPNIRRVFKRSGGISKRTKRSPRPKRANVVSSPAVDIPTSDSSSTASTNQTVESPSAQTNDISTTKRVKELTLPESNIPPSSEKVTPPREEMTLDLNVSNTPNDLEKDKEGHDRSKPIKDDASTPTCDSVASHVMTDPLEGEIGNEDDKERCASDVATEEECPLEHATSSETIDQEEPVNESNDTQTIATREEYISSKGVRFTPPDVHKEEHGPLVPYGLPCVRELLRFLISLVNPFDRHNSETMVHIGLSLLTVALESGAAHIGVFPSLMNLASDELCKNVFMLLQCEVHSLFAMALRVCFLLFEALRGHLKLQLESYFTRLLEVLSLDHQNLPYEKRELILDNINQLFHIPNLVSELYVNFDCDLYCDNIFEDLCKSLSKNAFPAGSLTTVNVPALDALLQVVNVIEAHCYPTLPLHSSPKSIKSKTSSKAGDDDSGTDENSDTPPSHPRHRLPLVFLWQKDEDWV